MQPNPLPDDPDETERYGIEIAEGGFRIIDVAGEVMLACGEEANARQYAALMNQAHCRGYKTGYRKAMNSRGKQMKPPFHPE